ncbi:MAG: PP2C family protein-serine/threonine phosphatase [Coriobacteriia bacterium]|nr:PP2C family protein-serine/threonine phosphatase [Coriobacteriia bacterium]
MLTLKQFTNAIQKNLLNKVEEGNIFKVNEITANLMVGLMMMLICCFILIIAILNQFDIFTADKFSMWMVVLTAFLISTPIELLIRYRHGDAPYFKYVLCIDLVVITGSLLTIIGHNAYLTMVIPVVLSVRYYDQKYTSLVAVISTVVYIAAAIGCVYFGIVNLNMCDKLLPDTTLFITDSLRAAVEPLVRGGVDVAPYLKSMIINELLPRIIIFSLIAIFCASIAKRGRQMLDLQYESAKKHTRIEGELNVATEIQNSMLPCIFPAFPEHKNLKLFATYTPAKEVGGDFYDYFQIDDDHIALVIADVSGKGVGAALFMTIAKILIKNEISTPGITPEKAIENVNNQLCENNEAALFVTAWVCVYEISTGKMTYVNAGHNPPILVKKGEKGKFVEELSGLVLAGYDSLPYKQHEMFLKPGDELFLYTDGLTEATDPDNELYGEERLMKIVEEVCSHPVEDQLHEVFDDIHKFIRGAEQFDDITMLNMVVG